MKRILFVCLALTNGGAERVVSVLSDSLLNDGYEIYIILLTNREQTYQIDERIHILRPEKAITGMLGKVYRITSIRKAIKKYNITTVIAFSHYNAMYSIIAARGLNVKVIGSERNDPAQLDDRKALNWLRLKLYRRLDCLVCQTDEAKEYFPHNIQELSVVILNPIMDSLPEPYTGSRSHRVVSFSRLEPQKNIYMLIEAFEIFHATHMDYVLEIYGMGSLRDELIERTKNNPAIRIQPYAKDIHHVILDASMFALASDYEGMSNAMIEAMGCGIPTIVTDCPCGGARMVIEDGVNGILVPVRDSKRMAEAMSRVADDKGLAEELSRNGLKIRETLDRGKIAEKWEEIINA